MGKRIEHPDSVRKAYIMWKDTAIAELIHEENTDTGEFDWVIKPLWDSWQAAVKRGCSDIAGIDETLHLDEYVRNYNPAFVTQRTIPEGRADLFPLLEKIGLTYNDLFEVLCRTHGICGNDDLYVSRTPDDIVDF